MGFIDISRPTKEYAWIYPYMEPRFQRVIAVASTAMVIKYRKLQLGLIYDQFQIITEDDGHNIENSGIDEETDTRDQEK